MGESQSLDELFSVAVSAIDAGDVGELDRLIAAHPTLVSDRLDAPGPWLRDKVGNALDNSNFAAAAHLVARVRL